MTMETYTLVIEETDTHKGIDADVFNEDGEIAQTTRVTYDDYALTADRDDWSPDPVEGEATADVMRLDLHVERDGWGFQFRLLGDDDELLRERVDDDDWRLATVEE